MSSSSAPASAAAASALPDSHCCTLCGMPGHWFTECAKFTSRDTSDGMSVSTRSPSGSSISDSEYEWSQEAISESAAAPSEALAQTPRYAQELAQILLREQGASSPTRTPAAIPPSDYVCKLCGVPGHWLIRCAKYVPHTTASASASRATAKSWRCEPCGKRFPLQSMLAGHEAQHVTCSYPTCSFSAAKRVVAAHVVAEHLPPPSSADAGALPPEVQAVSPPDGYLCKLCSVPGHWFIECAKFVRPRQPLKCEACDKAFALKSQLFTHCKRHVACQYAGCDFAASARVVTEHVRTSHGGGESLRATSTSGPSSPAVGSASAPFMNPLLADSCAICLVSSHRTYDCELLPKPTTRLPDEYCCEICGVPGHWIFYCPVVLASLPPVASSSKSTEHMEVTTSRPQSPLPLAPQRLPEPPLSPSPHVASAPMASPSPEHSRTEDHANANAAGKTAAAEPQPPGSSIATPKRTNNGMYIAPWLLKAGPPPPSYRCKACGEGGHYIYECAKRLPRAALAARSATAGREVATARDESAPLGDGELKPTAAPAAVAAQATASSPLMAPESAPSRPSSATAAAIRRCETCDLVFDRDSHLTSHYGDHVVCGYPGCGFSAVKRLVTKHVAAAHPMADAAAVSPTLPPANLTCLMCNKGGHWPSDCPEPKWRSGTGSGDAAKTSASKGSGAATSATAKTRTLWRCDACEKDFATESMLAFHLGQHIACPHPGCGFSAAKRLVTEHALAAHQIDRVTFGTPWTCRVCDKNFALESQLKAHAGTHPRHYFACKYPGCDFVSMKRKGLKQHTASAHAASASSLSQDAATPTVAGAKDGSRTAASASASASASALPGTALVEDNSDSDEEASDMSVDLATESEDRTRCQETGAAQRGNSIEGRASYPAPTSPAKRGKSWDCVPCDQAFATTAAFRAHQSTHVTCAHPSCNFSALDAVVQQHALTLHSPDRVAQASASTSAPPSQRAQTLAQSWLRDFSASRTDPQPPQAAPHATQTRRENGAGATNGSSSSSETWRCTTCDKSFTVESMFLQHLGQHIVCKFPGCGFSAVKRLVTEHAAVVHIQTAAPANVLPRGYCCRLCCIPGHDIRDCPKFAMGSGSSSAVTSGAGKSASSATPASKTSKNDKDKEWRCKTCDKSFKAPAILNQHKREHVVCSHPGCRFAALKRVVMEHTASVHRTAQHTSAQAPSSPMSTVVSASATGTSCAAEPNDVCAEDQEQEQVEDTSDADSDNDDSDSSDAEDDDNDDDEEEEEGGGGGGGGGDSEAKEADEEVIVVLGQRYVLRPVTVDGEERMVLVNVTSLDGGENSSGDEDDEDEDGDEDEVEDDSSTGR